MANKIFTSEELQAIEQAVINAEASTSGEIVPVFLHSASFYEIALWRGASLNAGLSSLILIILYFSTDLLLFAPPYLWLTIVLVSGSLGALAVQAIPPIKRKLLGKELQEKRTLDQAKNFFYDQQVANTEQRSGLLLMISFFEKRVIILPDIGLSELIEDQQWQTIIDRLTFGLKQQNITPSICEAILACGQLLHESGIQSNSDDEGQLSNELRQE